MTMISCQMSEKWLAVVIENKYKTQIINCIIFCWKLAYNLIENVFGLFDIRFLQYPISLYSRDIDKRDKKADGRKNCVSNEIKNIYIL